MPSTTLLKPLSFSRFTQAVQRVTDPLLLRQKAEGSALTDDFISITTQRKMMHRLASVDLLYVQGMKEYVCLVTSQQRVVTLESLKHLEEILPSERFQRVHKSFIVALDRVQVREGNQLIVGKTKIPIGRSYREDVLSRLQKI